MSAVERASEASSGEQANEWVARANEQTEERMEEQMAQYSTRQFDRHSAHCALFQNQLDSLVMD